MIERTLLLCLRNAILVLAIALSLSACDQLRSDLADFLSPPTDTQAVARLVDLSEAGRVADAIAFGERYLSNSKSSSPSVHAKLAQLYLDQGDAQRALLHLEQGNGSPPQAATHQRDGGSQKPASLETSEPLAPLPPDAVARVGPNGVEAQAGGARASVKP
jgi:hypothetical protein